MTRWFSWKSVLAALGSLAIVCGMWIGSWVYAFWPHCDREEKTLATQPGGRSVVSCFAACTSLGTTLTQAIQLRSATGKLQTILEYEPSGGIVGCRGKTFPAEQEPAADWSNPLVIHIAVSVVGDIIEKHDTVDGVHVTYDIGTVIVQDCDFNRS